LARTLSASPSDDNAAAAQPTNAPNEGAVIAGDPVLGWFPSPTRHAVDDICVA